jgi:2,3-bisphosphoglycerate-independent phosphoglycerate mutase
MEQDKIENSDPIESTKITPRPVVLVLLDAWGIAPHHFGNVFSNLKLRTFSALIKNYPSALLSCSGKTPAERYELLGAKGLLTETISAANLSQLNLTESEKLILAWHHFNGGRDSYLSKEDLKVLSSKIGNRAEQPEQVLSELMKIVLIDVKKGLHDFVVINLANLDLVSATGDLEAAKRAAKILDKKLGQLVSAVTKHQGVLIVSAAYGHAEAMLNMATELAQDGITDNNLPFIIVGQEYEGKTLGWPDVLGSDLSLVEPVGTLTDVAPTILKILNITPPANLGGESLI